MTFGPDVYYRAGMTPTQVLRKYGYKAGIAHALRIDRQVVQGWYTRGIIPLDHQIRLEVLSRGELKADVGEPFRQLVRNQISA